MRLKLPLQCFLHLRYHTFTNELLSFDPIFSLRDLYLFKASAKEAAQSDIDE